MDVIMGPSWPLMSEPEISGVSGRTVRFCGSFCGTNLQEKKRFGVGHIVM